MAFMTNVVLCRQTGADSGHFSVWHPELGDGSEAAARQRDRPVFGLRQR